MCTQRIPAILARIDRVTARINADLATRGSTAWLQARQDRAEAAGHGDVADRIQKRIDARPAKLDSLAGAKTRVTDFRDDELRLVNATTPWSRARTATLLVLVAALAALILGGCQAGDRAAASVVPTAGAGSDPGAAGSPDPLAGVEAMVEAVERDLDADAGVAGR